MPWDIDDADLYPPDAETVTEEGRQQRLRAAIGAALVVWGTSLLVQRALNVDLDTFLLGIGLGGLAGWAQVRRFAWFAVGAILTGIGLSDLVDSLFNGPLSSSLSSLLVAGGFGALYVRYPGKAKWAIFPAGIMVLIAVGALGLGLIGLIPAAVGSFLLPLLLIMAGGLLLFRHSIPGQTRRVALAAMAALFVLVAASNIGEIGSISFANHRDRFGGRAVSEPIPSLEGKTLVIVSNRGDVDIRESSSVADRVVTTRGSDPNPQITDDEVRYEINNADYRLTIPTGTDVRVVTDSGDVTIVSSGLPQLALVSDDGEITVDDEEYDSPHRVTREIGPKVTVTTDDGDIDVKTAA